MGLDGLLRTARKIVHDNSNTILSGVGVVGTLSTAYLAGRASYISAQVIGRKEEDLDRTQDPLTIQEKTKLVWQLYIPAAISGTVTIASIMGASKVSSQRTAAYAAAYSLSERTFSEYKEKVIEQLGERKEQNIHDEVVSDRMKRNPPGDTHILIADPNKVLCCELYTGRYFQSDMETLRKAQNDINAKIISELYTPLSDFYNLIGLESTTVSDNMGWDSDRLMELRFTTVMSSDDKPCIAFEYNYLKTI